MLAVTQHILTCITAHRAACEAGILHRDISASNIMLVDSKTSSQCGILIDWDLSKAIDPNKPDAARQFTRTVSKVSDVVCLLSS
jgi:RIO-like serine/threonine protein kinase